MSIPSLSLFLFTFGLMLLTIAMSVQQAKARLSNAATTQPPVIGRNELRPYIEQTAVVFTSGEVVQCYVVPPYKDEQRSIIP